jgi:cytochrome d ubiquinol oxidase subunit I
MQNPVGAKFNPDTMRMELTSFWDVFFNPVAQAKFVHTVSAGYVTGAVFVLAVSAYYLLRGRNREFALRSMAVAVSFGLASALSVVVLGDESGYMANEHQKMKVAAIESEWDTQAPPASFNAFAIPDVAAHKNSFEIKIPWLLGLVATRSLHEPVEGINNLVVETEGKIRSGIKAYDAMQRYRADKTNLAARKYLEDHGREIGYALLLKHDMDDPRKATDADIARAAWHTVPDVTVLFWSFRLMVACGLAFIALFVVGFYFSAKRELDKHKWFLWWAVWMLPFPWIASELGWIVAEYGRQPWAVEGLLPTGLAASNVPAADVWITLAGFVMFYSVLLVADIYLLRKYIRRGPDQMEKPNAA